MSRELTLGAVPGAEGVGSGFGPPTGRAIDLVLEGHEAGPRE